MAELTIDDESSSELEESEIGIGALFPAHEEAAEAVEPGVRDFDDPATGRMTVGMAWGRERLGGTGLGRDMGDQVMVLGGPAAGVVVVAAVQDQMPLRRGGVVGRIGRERGVQEGFELLHIGAVGPGDYHADRNTPAVGQQVPFGAGFAPVRGVAAGGERFTGPPFLPSGALVRHPSAACQVRSSPTRSS